MRANPAPLHVPRPGLFPCIPPVSPRGGQGCPSCKSVMAPAALQAASRCGLRPSCRPSAASCACKGCATCPGLLRRSWVSPWAWGSGRDGAACERSYGRSGFVSLPRDPPAFPFDPGAKPSLRRNVFRGEVGAAPAAEFFHAQRLSPALNVPITWAVSALLQSPI